MGYLTTGEFQRWTEQNDRNHQANHQALLEALREHAGEHGELKGRVAALESNQTKAGTTSARWSVVTSAIVTGLANAAMAFFGAKHG